MGLTYFKRYRMEIDFSDGIFAPPPMPTGYRLLPWSTSLLQHHAEAKYQSFCHEIDANVFPCLGQREGCQRLMKEISQRRDFVPQSTWLLQCQQSPSSVDEMSGTIQGIRHDRYTGSVQNIGVTPQHRSQGLGTQLLHAALLGFQAAGMARVQLEVTAQNTGALRLYQRLGFRRIKTVYKAAEVVYA